MTTSNALVAVDNKLDGALTHYGVKGMKWGKKKAKEDEIEPTPGGGKVNNHDDDLREMQEINEYLETVFKAKDSSEIDYDKFNAMMRRMNNIEARINARNAYEDQRAESEGLPRVRDSRPPSARTPTPTKTPGDMFKADLTTKELIERSKRRKRALQQSDDLDDYLMHYGVKGMRWGVRKDKDEDKPKSKSKTTIDKTKPNTKIKEEEPAASGGGGRANTEEEDLRELEAINGVLESGGDMSLKEFTTLLRRKSEIQKRMDARNKPDDEKSSSRKEPKKPKATDKITSEGVSIDKVFNLNSDLTTEERIARGRKRRLEREKRNGSAKHSDLLSVKMKDIASGNHLAHYQAVIDLDDYLMHYGVLGMKWGVRKDRNKSSGTRSKKKSSSSESSDKQGTGESSKSGSNSGSTKTSKNLTTDQKLDRLDKLSEEKSEILNYTDEVKKAAREVTSSSGETLDGPLKTILEFHPKGVDIADGTADKMGFYDPNSDKDIKKLLKKYRKREFRHDEAESDLDDYLMHYGVKGMRWGVRKDRKTGRVKSVAKRTPLVGKNETGKVRDAVDNAPGGKANHKAVRRAYLDARVPIKQGLRNINNDDRFKGKDLTNEKSKLVKQYHKEISSMVTEKLAMSAIIKSRKNDKVIPKLDYDMSKSSEPQLSELRSKNQYDQPGIKKVARQVRDRDMNTTDKAIRVAKRGAVTAAAYTAASQAIGAGIVGAMLIETLYGESTPSMIRGLNDSSSELIRKEMEKSLRQSDEDQVTVVIDPIMDDLGHILDVEFDVVSNTMTHDELNDLDDYLMHYGVKGMRWGVRKDGRPQGHQGGSSKSKSKSASDKLKARASKLSSSAKKKIRKATDPKERAKRVIRKQKRKADIAEAKAEADARIAEAEKKAAAARKAIETTRTATTAKTGSGSMSDKELKAVVERMNLEKQYAKHMSDAKPKKMSSQLMKFAKDTAIDYGKQRLKAEIHRNLGNNFDKLFKVADAAASKDDPTPEPEAKNPFTFKAPKPKAPKAPKPKGPPRSEPRTQSSPTRPTPPSYVPSRPALMSPPNPSILALPAPKPKGPSSGPSASARMKDNPTVAKFGKVSMDQVQAYKEGRPYKPFDPRRRR